MTLPMFNTLTILLMLVSMYIIYLLNKYVIQVLLKMRFYQNQLGHTFQYEYFPLIGFMRTMLKIQKIYGDPLHQLKRFTKLYPQKKGIISNIGYKVFIQIIDVEMAKQYSESQYGNFEGDPVYFTNVFLQMGDYTLGGMEGQMWKHYRNLLGNAFNFDKLKEFPPRATAVARKYLQNWCQADSLNPPKDLLKQRMAMITSEIILEGFFGMNLNGIKMDGEPIQLKLLQFKEIAGLRQRSKRVALFGLWIAKTMIFKEDREVYHLYNRLRQVFRTIINDKKQERLKGTIIENNCFLDFMLSSHIEEEKMIQRGSKVKYHLSVDSMIDQFMGIVSASMDTSANLLTCVMFILSKNPSYIDRIRDETKHIDMVQFSDFAELKYLDAFVKECLRMYTPTPILKQRNAIKDCKIGKLNILKDTIVDYYCIAQAFSEDQWTNPFEFNPERWMQDKTPYKDCYAYAPYGIGQRNCIGQHLANAIIKSIIIVICQNGQKLEINNKYDYLRMCGKFTYEPEEKLVLRFMLNTE